MAPRVARSVAKSTANQPEVQKPKGKRGGPRPNSGPLPSVIREAYRMAARNRLGFILDVVDGKVKDAQASDRLRAWDMLNKYGIGTTVTNTDVDGKDAAPGRLTPDAMRDAVAAILGLAP